jgi:hypothetical protein
LFSSFINLSIIAHIYCDKVLQGWFCLFVYLFTFYLFLFIYYYFFVYCGWKYPPEKKRKKDGKLHYCA